MAAQLAANALARTGTDYALSVTGYAGPEGGTGQNPVGTVYLGIASAAGARAKRFQFTGDRARVRRLATQYALDLLRMELLRSESSGKR